MKLHVENFAKISSADIAFDGLTVIAGANNTGKSTVGKILYSIFRGQSNIDRRVAEERLKTVREAFFSVTHANLSDAECRSVLEGRVAAHELLKEKVRASFLSGGEDNPSRDEQMVEDLVRGFEKNVVERVDAARQTPGNQVAWVILRRVFKCVFHGQYHPLVSNERDALVSLTVKGEENRIVFRSDAAETNFPTRLFARAHLINTPDVLGYMNVGDLEHSSQYARLLDKYVYELAVDDVMSDYSTMIGHWLAVQASRPGGKPLLWNLDELVGASMLSDVFTFTDDEFVAFAAERFSA